MFLKLFYIAYWIFVIILLRRIYVLEVENEKLKKKVYERDPYWDGK